MFKKLVLLILGGAGAAAGFSYFTQMPADQAEALVDSLVQQKVNLESVAKDIANSDVVKRAIDKSKDALAESPQVQTWLNDQLRDYARQQQVELGEEDALELVDAVMALRQFSESENLDGAGKPALSQDAQQRLATAMARGDAVFNQHLGIPMSQFLKRLSESSALQMVRPEKG